VLAIAVGTDQLQFGRPPRTQPGRTLDEDAERANVDYSNEYTGTEHRLAAPAGGVGTRAARPPAFTPCTHGTHAARAGSKRSTRTRPVLPVRRTAICGPRGDAT
jgi:hypothetical protein